jgi:hypothetical protein
LQTAIRLLRPMLYAPLFVISSEMAAHADIGVPMIFVTLPSMVIALLPVIAAETFVLGRRLGVAPVSVLKAVASANIVSTLFGIPVTWLMLVLVQLVTGGGSAYGIATTKQRFLAVTWQAPWLIPYEQELKWMIPAATLVLLIPFFVASWLIEEKIVRGFLKESAPAAVKQGMFAANGASYLLLGLLVLYWLLKAVR